MERIRLMVLRNWWRVPWMFIRLLWFGRKNCKAAPATKYKIIKEICYRANTSGNVDVEVSGLENLPKEGGYILFPNHQGLFDVLSILHMHEKPVRVVMKKEAETNFFLRIFLRLLNGQAMDRDDVKQSMKVINRMAEEVKEGAIYLIFAEGTRSRKGNELLDFKGGSFKSATKAKCPIVPVAIIDSYKAFDTHSTDQLTVQAHFLDPIYPEEYQGMKTMEIADEVKSRIEKVIKENEHKS